MSNFRIRPGVEGTVPALGSVSPTAVGSNNADIGGSVAGKLISWWDFHDHTSIPDQHGSNNLTIAGTLADATGPDGVAGSAALLTGSGDRVYHATTGGLDLPSGDFTVGIWAKMDSPAPPNNTPSMVIFHGSDSTTPTLINFDIHYWNGSTSWGGECFRGGTVYYSSPGAATLGQWEFFVAQYNRSTFKYRTFKAADTSKAWTSTVAAMNNNSGILQFGYGPTSSNWYFSNISLFGGFAANYILDDSEINWLYNGGSGRTYADL